ncbi:MAG: hypothetical protein WBA53_04415 [Burkholderiaceae bacterium]
MKVTAVGRRIAASALSACLLLPALAQASEEERLATQLANPIASLISVPFQNNWERGIGPKGWGARLSLTLVFPR